MNFGKIVLLIGLLASCSVAQVASKRVLQPKCEQYVYERLHNFFRINEVRPTQIINNVNRLEPWQSRAQRIRIGDHTIDWITEVTRNSSRASVRINDELITIDDKVTTNMPDGDDPFTLNMIDEWDQVRLYDLYGKTMIAISMGPRQCTGLMCGVGAQLWYDVKTKQKTFFGTFRTESDPRLFRFTNEEDFHVVTTNFDGDPHGVTSPAVITYNLYKLQPSGQLQIQRNAAGREYFIRHTTFPDMELKGDKVQKRKVSKCDKLEQNWMSKIESP